MKRTRRFLVVSIAVAASGFLARAQAPDPFGTELAIDTIEIVEPDESLVTGPLDPAAASTYWWR